MAVARGPGVWRPAAALALAVILACNDPLAPTGGNDNAPVVEPVDTDSGQASVLAENRHPGDAGWKETGKADPLQLALWASPYAVSPGDNADWNIRMSPGPVTGRRGETLTCYKYQPDPAAPVREETTTKFREPPLDRPESELVGDIYEDLLPGGANPPMEVPPDSLLGPYARAFARAAGLVPGDTIAIGAGMEGDQIYPGGRYTPAGTEMLLRAVYQGRGSTPRYYHSTFYVAPSGAGVWATGTDRWAAYLDGDRAPANPRVQALTREVLGWMDRH